MRAQSAYFREITRSITGSLGRFLAIVGIVALGCGFFAGLKMSGPDMRAAGDALYDGCDLYDLRVVSTLGFTDDDVERLSAIEGIEALSPSRSVDVMARLGHEQFEVRILQLDVDAAKESTFEGDCVVVSADGSYLNRPILREGRWPNAADECVLCADKPVVDFGIGDTVEVLYGATELDGTLVPRDFKVVGLVSSPVFPYIVSFGSTSLGSGQIKQYVMVGKDAFDDDAPYTEVYATVEGAREELSESDAYLDVVGAVRERIEAVEDGLAAARRADVVRDPQKEIDDGRAELERERKKTEKELDDARAELDDAAAQIEQLETYAAAARAAGNAQLTATLEAYLAEAKESYDEGLSQLEDGEREAEEEFAKAERELDDAQAELDDVEIPDIYVLDRTKSEGHVAYHNDTLRMDSIADVFPLMFFLVAALVALTTMTRMVDDDRQLIGTHKALGLSTAQIALKYLLYAALASTVGAALGIVLLSEILPYVVTSSYAIIYTPPVRFPLPIDVGFALAAGGLGVGVTLVATLFAVVTSLREAPATLMLPRPPARGKRILLERVGFIWRRVSFSWKVTLRNLFRYKRRFTMTVLGVAGCTALLLVGFGLHDAVWDIIECQFGPIIHYNLTVVLDDDVSETGIDEAIELLNGKGEADKLVRIQQENMLAGSDGVDSTQFVSVIVPKDAAEIDKMVTFRERISKKPVPFGGDAVVITEKLASLLGIGVGDEVVLYGQDAVGNASGEGIRFVVDGITENYVGNFVYAGRGKWADAYDADIPFSTLLVSVTDDEDVRVELAETLEADEDVSTVVFTSEDIETYSSMLSVVDLVVVVLIVSAGALVGVVLYNLTNINIEERIREIASLKVLGFTRREVYQYIFREVLMLTVIGDALGMVLGTFLETFVVTTAEVDYVMFGRTIHPLSYVLAFVITIVFALIVLAFMRHKLDRVNMVESLKSVD